ncbi:MAG: threonylcarbamoyl-AMP synthase [Lachnospiraceae bacterium]|nr:threonylcarbamoyl-AMP synthase [Lachnospiraceae bacterium]
MDTKYILIDNKNIDSALISEAGQIIRNGGLVAFPTETVYGLGADAANPDASRKIYAAKGRPSDNPLIVHICEFSQLEDIAEELPPVARELSDAFWPGPMTLIVKKNEKIPYETTGGLDTVAVRMPSDPIAAALIRASERLIAAPSANASGRPSPTRASHVKEDLDGKIDMIIDGGECGLGLESTIIDLSDEEPVILRPGCITPEMLNNVIGKVSLDKGLAPDSDTRPKAPGMKYRHYAPKGKLLIIEGNDMAVADKINSLVAGSKQVGRKAAVICTEETRGLYDSEHIYIIGRRSDESSIAHNLFAVLRKMDEDGFEDIYSESFSGAGVGTAIMNRLLKAAGHQIIEV